MLLPWISFRLELVYGYRDEIGISYVSIHLYFSFTSLCHLRPFTVRSPKVSVKITVRCWSLHSVKWHWNILRYWDETPFCKLWNSIAMDWIEIKSSQWKKITLPWPQGNIKLVHCWSPQRKVFIREHLPVLSRFGGVDYLGDLFYIQLNSYQQLEACGFWHTFSVYIEGNSIPKTRCTWWNKILQYSIINRAARSIQFNKKLPGLSSRANCTDRATSTSWRC
jgi:hypothetical protein